MFKRQNKQPTERLAAQPTCPTCGSNDTRLAFVDLNTQSARVSCRRCNSSFRVDVVDTRPREHEFGTLHNHSH